MIYKAERDARENFCGRPVGFISTVIIRNMNSSLEYLEKSRVLIRKERNNKAALKFKVSYVSRRFRYFM